jgi:hypothetical protein
MPFGQRADRSGDMRRNTISTKKSAQRELQTFPASTKMA